jgi:hypothetical protein
MLPSAVILSAVAVVALVLTRARPLAAHAMARGDAARSLALAVCAQAGHFAEEAVPCWGNRPCRSRSSWSSTWAGWRSGRPRCRGCGPGDLGAVFAAWFLAIAGLFNGIAHPLMAVAVGGYFPGLVTSPVIGVAGAALCIRLHRATRPDPVA